MAEPNNIILFEEKLVRRVWDEAAGKWNFSVVDVVQILTDSVDGRKYWNKLKQRLKEEAGEPVTFCHQLKMLAADGKIIPLKKRGGEGSGNTPRNELDREPQAVA